MIRVLLVDDDPLILLAAGATLRADGGFTVREAATAGDALACVAGETFDVVVTDLHLPDLDGTALLERLRALPACAATPVVFLTATASPADAERLRALGARGVIAKPFRPASLAPALRELLAG